MEHQKKLNKGLENKIILLQQKLSDSQKENKELKKAQKDNQSVVKELEALKWDSNGTQMGLKWDSNETQMRHK